MKKLKIALIASAGGHLSQLLRVEQSWRGHEVFFVTTSRVVEEHLLRYGRVYVVPECNRKMPVKVLLMAFTCLKIVMRERPDIAMSTGAASGCVVCILTKLFGGKVVWIDSITNTSRISLSGRLVWGVSDLFLVQWPGLAGRYKKAEYAGALL